MLAGQLIKYERFISLRKMKQTNVMKGYKNGCDKRGTQ